MRLRNEQGSYERLTLTGDFFEPAPLLGVSGAAPFSPGISSSTKCEIEQKITHTYTTDYTYGLPYTYQYEL